jgi:ubiquinol-cytochrome c reductase cytochrome c1 subunit
MMPNRLIVAAALAALCSTFALSSALAQEEGGVPVEASHADIKDIQSLQRGARNFMNYCSGCHSMQYLRYNRMAHDLQIPEADLQPNLMFTSDKPFDTIVSSLPTEDAATWFGKAPPDLTLMARERGSDYIYSFLKGFYVDPARPWGVNNIYLPNVAMPHVLASLQGLQKPEFKNEPDANGNAHMVLADVKLMSPGALTPEEYDRFVRDITNFLDYAGEPIKAKRERLGVFITLFLLAGLALAWALKKEYWKDVH